LTAIILFSGLGSIEVAQESLSVGIGALAGSTIMLLTVPWSLSVFAGRVDILDGNKPNYTKRPKLTEGGPVSHSLWHTGVAVTDEIRHGGVIMAITTIPYFLIQVPASFLHGPAEQVAEGEHWYALGGRYRIAAEDDIGTREKMKFLRLSFHTIDSLFGLSSWTLLLHAFTAEVQSGRTRQG
jgi:hypothetical protein